MKKVEGTQGGRSNSDLIQYVEVPINVFRSQIIIGIGTDMAAVEEPPWVY